jgi:hypothetical protein
MAKSKAQRLKENSDVKNGEIRRGRAGNKFNKWDKKTATWVPVSSARTGEGSGQKDTLKRGITRAKNTGGAGKKAAAARAANRTPAQNASAANGGFVRGSGNGQRASAARTANARAQNTTHGVRNAAAIAALTVGPLLGAAGLAARGGAAAAGRLAVGAGRTPKAVGGGSVKAIGGGAKSVGRATPPKAVTRGTAAQRAAATRAANKAKIATAKKVAKSTTRKRAVTIAKRAGV